MLFIFTTLHSSYHPFGEDRLNRLELSSLVCTAMTFFLGKHKPKSLLNNPNKLALYFFFLSMYMCMYMYCGIIYFAGYIIKGMFTLDAGALGRSFAFTSYIAIAVNLVFISMVCYMGYTLLKEHIAKAKERATRSNQLNKNSKNSKNYIFNHISRCLVIYVYLAC